MTEQFDEGYKEILMGLLSLGATAYETDYILKALKERPEPIEQKIDAVEKADELIASPRFDKVASEILQQLKIEKPPIEINSEPDIKPVTGSIEYILNRLTDGGLTKTAAIGVVANLKAESNLDPAIKQQGSGS